MSKSDEYGYTHTTAAATSFLDSFIYFRDSRWLTIVTSYTGRSRWCYAIVLSSLNRIKYSLKKFKKKTKSINKILLSSVSVCTNYDAIATCNQRIAARMQRGTWLTCFRGRQQKSAFFHLTPISSPISTPIFELCTNELFSIHHPFYGRIKSRTRNLKKKTYPCHGYCHVLLLREYQ